MRFTLHYSGLLKSKADAAHKHEIRRVFHSQLAELWKQEPLRHLEYVAKAKEKEGQYNSLRSRGLFTFVPLVTEEMKLVADLTITMLRPGAPGRLIFQGGDIDNRLKTLFDALAIPPQTNALPDGAGPAADEDPFFTVLEDDALITAVSVETQQLLKNMNESHVELVIGVHVTAVSRTFGNNVLV